jgi:hypothetical protein
MTHENRQKKLSNWINVFLIPYFVETSIHIHVVCLWINLAEESNKSKKFSEFGKISYYLQKSLKKLSKWINCFSSLIFVETSIPTHIVCLWINLGEKSTKSIFFNWDWKNLIIRNPRKSLKKSIKMNNWHFESNFCRNFYSSTYTVSSDPYRRRIKTYWSK